MRLILVLRAYLMLIYFDYYLARGNFAALYDKVRSYPVGKKLSSLEAANETCAAVDLACIWYWKEARCLQRSAATTCLLRRNAVPALLVIGAQQIPFRAHAWVEVQGQIVNDKPYAAEIYSVLDKC